MSYVALYREWRPRTFAEVVGQQHIVRTLQNALVQGRLAHAYLFCGPRGTGKTSVAKILARAVNCQAGPSAEPCGACPSCERIGSGGSLDVLEIDAASNRGIDEIRDLREKVKYAPAEARRKVYIIDEVHMLTPEAFNALLKTLEEPPPHVMFILATTEPHRLPLTILSRCQRFDFHRLSTGEILGRVRDVAARQARPAEEAALLAIARAAEGGLRDALSLLDQCLSAGDGPLTVDQVLAVTGSVRAETLFELADFVAGGDTTGALRLVNRALEEGRDLRQFARDLTGHFRDLLLVAVSNEAAGLLERTAEDLAKLRQQAGRFRASRLAAIVRSLADTENDLRWTTQPRLVLEVAVVRLCQPAADDDLASLAERLAALERAVAAQAASPAGTAAPSAPAGPATPARIAELPALTLDEVKRVWPAVEEKIKRTKRPTHAVLVDGRPVGVAGDKVILEFKHEFHRGKIDQPEHRQVVERALSETLGGRRISLSTTLARESTPDAPGEAAPDGATDPIVARALAVFGGETVEIED